MLVSAGSVRTNARSSADWSPLQSIDTCLRLGCPASGAQRDVLEARALRERREIDRTRDVCGERLERLPGERREVERLERRTAAQAHVDDRGNVADRRQIDEDRILLRGSDALRFHGDACFEGRSVRASSRQLSHLFTPRTSGRATSRR
jgi:hypothetical protein